MKFAMDNHTIKQSLFAPFLRIFVARIVKEVVVVFGRMCLVSSSSSRLGLGSSSGRNSLAYDIIKGRNHNNRFLRLILEKGAHSFS